VIDHLAILAPGLLGGSVGLAARARGAARRITVWARRPEVRLALAEQPWVDSVAETPEGALSEASLVVLAAPVTSIIALAQRIAPTLPPEALVTDVGSTKGDLVRACHGAIPGGRFVGAHPMAGSEKTGWENGRADLFERRMCFVTPVEGTRPDALEAVVRFWRDLGSEVTTLHPDRHDEIVAHISHLPQAIATTLCTCLAQRESGWRNFAGGGLRDTTRIAGGDPGMWIDILEQNRDEILRALRAFQTELEGFHAALANRDWPELRSRLERGRAYRSGFRP
jgi:cyclohexadieny/prephenate dehydrogenase